MGVIQQIVNGLALGGVYSLLAIGWTMVWGIVGMINWTHGEVFMLGGFAGFFLLTIFHLHFVSALLLSALICGILAMTIDHIGYKPLRAARAPRVALLITALGFSTFLKNTTSLVVSPDPKAYPRVIEQEFIELFSLGGKSVSINNLQLVILVTTAILMLGLQLFIRQTKVGKAMIAASQDVEAVSLMGASVQKLMTVTFLISGMLGGGAGVLVGTLYSIDPWMGSMAGIKGWEAAVVGGIGSLSGAMVAGVLLGIVENLTAAYISSGWRDAIGFLLMILTLIFKPSGLMGLKVEDKV
ncbi:MAG: branched-chain amino acid ABC transporter permease [Bacillota bacterium]